MYLAAVALTLLEYAGAVVGGHVPEASDSVVDVLAPDGSHWAWFTCTEAKQAIRHKVLCVISRFGMWDGSVCPMVATVYEW